MREDLLTGRGESFHEQVFYDAYIYIIKLGSFFALQLTQKGYFMIYPQTTLFLFGLFFI